MAILVPAREAKTTVPSREWLMLACSWKLEQISLPCRMICPKCDAYLSIPLCDRLYIKPHLCTSNEPISQSKADACVLCLQFRLFRPHLASLEDALYDHCKSFQMGLHTDLLYAQEMGLMLFQAAVIYVQCNRCYCGLVSSRTDTIHGVCHCPLNLLRNLNIWYLSPGVIWSDPHRWGPSHLAKKLHRPLRAVSSLYRMFNLSVCWLSPSIMVGTEEI